MPHVGSENNMRSHNRRTRPGVPAKWDHRRRQSNSDRIAFSDLDSDSYAYSQWHPVVHSNAKCQRQSFEYSKCDGHSFGDAKRNSKSYHQSFGHPECYSERHGKS